MGAAWAILQPLMTMIVFSIFFGHLAEVSSFGVIALSDLCFRRAIALDLFLRDPEERRRSARGARSRATPSSAKA